MKVLTLSLATIALIIVPVALLQPKPTTATTTVPKTVPQKKSKAIVPPWSVPRGYSI